MNNQLLEKINQLRCCMLEEECVKEYIQYKNLVAKRKELIDLEEEVHFLQKQLMAKRYYGKEADDLAKTYATKREMLDENPIIVNYIQAKEEAKNYLEHISLYISSRL